MKKSELIKTLSITTDPVDEDLVKAEVVQLDPDFYDYSQLTFICYNYGALGYDSEGDLRYYSKFPALPLTRLSDGHYASYTSDFADQRSATFAGVVEFDLCGRVYNRYDLPGGAHHEILELPNGNLLIGSSHDDLSSVNCRAVEVERETGNIVWDVLLFDNGCSRVKTVEEIGVTGEDVYSRTVVYHLNTDTMTASQEWEYGKERGASWYSAYISGATYDRAKDTYWLCSGGIQYDPVGDNYDLSVTSFNGDLKVQYSALIDAVQDNELKYELRVGRNVYRSARMALYPNTATSLDLTEAGRRFQIKDAA